MNATESSPRHENQEILTPPNPGQTRVPKNPSAVQAELGFNFGIVYKSSGFDVHQRGRAIRVDEEEVRYVLPERAAIGATDPKRKLEKLVWMKNILEELGFEGIR